MRTNGVLDKSGRPASDLKDKCIYLFGMLLIRSTPLVVEAGILLDLTVAVFVIGIIVDRIQREFDTLDTRKLTVLRE
jgi:hydrogenase-4 component E